ncbi:hypothetical protein H0H87_001519 [Tephrocybe sp. NHM501043]|nr:hypothetical protein H0H87_001519 [Tephrocybe sp. NHM501043]
MDQNSHFFQSGPLWHFFPLSPYLLPQSKLILGEGEASAAHGYTNVLNEIGNANDAGWNAGTRAYLSTALGRYFRVRRASPKPPNEKRASGSAIKYL